MKKNLVFPLKREIWENFLTFPGYFFPVFNPGGSCWLECWNTVGSRCKELDTLGAFFPSAGSKNNDKNNGQKN